MLSDFAPLARVLVTALAAAILSGCGIKGPLKPPPKPAPETQEREAAPRSP
ncbi:MAG TPA: lipoprotein [Casimicrobiaceae bacterium]|nr:lipoprotein [Casimicrobiaceae bacterium]